ncbi:MAG: hypothetical protein AAF809_12890 [Bacteroidota bacterium]
MTGTRMLLLSLFLLAVVLLALGWVFFRGLGRVGQVLTVVGPDGTVLAGPTPAESPTDQP